MNPNKGDLDREETPQFPGRQKSPYRFTQEEIRVLKDCNRESFFKRCLPLGSLFGVGTYFAVTHGYLKPNVRYGATPKVVCAVIVGYFVGKFSYQTVCAEKLMQLPNSQIGEMLRQRRRGNLRESLEPGFGPGMSLAPFGNISPSDTYTDLDPQNNVDIDTTRPQNDGLDDSQRPSVDNPIYDEEMPPVQKHVTTYEELRKKNREEYQQKRTALYREPAKSLSITPDVKPSEDQQATDRPIRRNKYGDAFD